MENLIEVCSSIPQDISEYIQSILPQRRTKIIVAREVGDQLFLRFYTQCRTVNEIKTWLTEFQEQTKTSFSIRNTSKNTGRYVIFKQTLNCQHNTRSKEVHDITQQRRRKNTNCPAAITITLHSVKARYQGKDKEAYLLRKEMPCEMTMICTHNHDTESMEILRFRKVGTGAKEKLLELFNKGHSPAIALEILKNELCKSAEDPMAVLSDRYQCPDYVYCYRLYKKEFCEKYGTSEFDTSPKQIKRMKVVCPQQLQQRVEPLQPKKQKTDNQKKKQKTEDQAKKQNTIGLQKRKQRIDYLQQKKQKADDFHEKKQKAVILQEVATVKSLLKPERRKSNPLHCKVTPEVKQKLLNLFNSGHSPMSALETIKAEIYLNYDDPESILADKTQCPDDMYCYRLYRKAFHQNCEPEDFDRSVRAQNKEILEEYKAQLDETTTEVVFDGTDYIVCTGENEALGNEYEIEIEVESAEQALERGQNAIMKLNEIFSAFLEQNPLEMADALEKMCENAMEVDTTNAFTESCSNFALESQETSVSRAPTELYTTVYDDSNEIKIIAENYHIVEEPKHIPVKEHLHTISENKSNRNDMSE